jgi:hypothetical protein
MIAIYNGKSCDKLGSSFDDDGSYDSNKNGKAVGSFKLDSAYDLDDLECKYIVIFDDGSKKEKKDSKKDDDDDDDADDDDDKKKKKKKDSKKDDDDDDDDDDDKKKKKDSKRKLAHAPRSSHHTKRSLQSIPKKGKSSKVNKIGCGQIVPAGKKNACK